MKFSISVQKWRHSGPTDPYWQEVAVVEAPTCREAGEQFAAASGLRPCWWFSDSFDLGTNRYKIGLSHD